MTSYDSFPSSNSYPTKDDDNNPLETEYGMCVYKDHQTLTIQVKYVYLTISLFLRLKRMISVLTIPIESFESWS